MITNIVYNYTNGIHTLLYLITIIPLIIIIFKYSMVPFIFNVQINNLKD